MQTLHGFSTARGTWHFASAQASQLKEPYVNAMAFDDLACFAYLYPLHAAPI